MIRSLVTAALLCHLLFLLFLTTSTVWAFPNVWMEAPTRVYSTGLVTSIYDTIDYDVQIRDALVEDLPQVTDLLMDSFYNDNTSPLLWSNRNRAAQSNDQALRIDQLRQLEDNYLDSETMKDHKLLVAAALPLNVNDGVVQDVVKGFVYLDNRPPPHNRALLHCPRPILSDLVVCPSVRRSGIGRTLITACEDLVWNEYGEDALYLRVDETNVQGLQFFENMGYEYCPEMDEPSRPELVMMRKWL